LKFSLLLRIDFASFHFRFSDAKKTFFASKQQKFHFCFASFRFEAKMMALSLLFRFLLSFILVSLQSSTFRIDAKQAKNTFFASKRKKFCFRFASFRFEAKMTAHPKPEPDPVGR
jgi:hypothetical protein